MLINNIDMERVAAEYSTFAEMTKHFHVLVAGTMMTPHGLMSTGDAYDTQSCEMGGLYR